MSSTADRPVVLFHDLSRTFGTGSAAVSALAHATGRVEPGEQIAVVGSSGSGKSTLLHLLAGLDRPTTGTIAWPALGDPPVLRPGPVAVVFQSPSLLAALDVIENVALPLVLAGTPDAEARRRAAEALTALDLDDVSGQLPEELSGGQAQRVATARALVGRPRLILADEPTGQLDAGTADAVVRLLVTAAELAGAALVVATHDPCVADRLAQRWTMSDGHLTVAHGASCSS